MEEEWEHHWSVAQMRSMMLDFVIRLVKVAMMLMAQFVGDSAQKVNMTVQLYVLILLINAQMRLKRLQLMW